MTARASGLPTKPKSATGSALAAALGDAVRAHRAGRLEAAAAGYQHVLARSPQHPDALHLLGLVAHQRGQQAEAQRLVTAALNAAPRTAAFHNTLAAVRLAQGDAAAAIDAARRAVALDPKLVPAHNTLGNALLRAGDRDAAIASYRQALAMAADNPEALNNLGSALREQGDVDAAQAMLVRALALRPDYPAAEANLALVRRDQGQFAEALAGCERALARQPDNATWRANRATLLLQLGRFADGWADYECRWQADGFVREAEPCQVPAWDGSDPARRTLLLRGEQGFGSMIQFARYAPLLAAQGARVFLQCPAPLQRLFTASFAAPAGPVAAVVTKNDRLPPVDAQAPLMSLPHLCRTTLATIPADVPYLRAEPGALAAWDQRLGPHRRRRIGLVWAGNPAHANDRNRSLPAATLAPLLSAVDAAFVSLQVGGAPLPSELVAAGLIDAAPALVDFAETAAAVAGLDLVISVDTAVAHLAAALAKPVWLLLPHVPEWRWLIDRDDTPWYPTMRLFRQSRPGDWAELIARVAGALAASDG